MIKDATSNNDDDDDDVDDDCEFITMLNTNRMLAKLNT